MGTGFLTTFVAGVFFAVFFTGPFFATRLTGAFVADSYSILQEDM